MKKLFKAISAIALSTFMATNVNAKVYTENGVGFTLLTNDPGISHRLIVDTNLPNLNGSSPRTCRDLANLSTFTGWEIADSIDKMNQGKYTLRVSDSAYFHDSDDIKINARMTGYFLVKPVYMELGRRFGTKCGLNFKAQTTIMGILNQIL